ncbi:TPA: hypothetical protein HA239_01580 [Candidatus Woesearchaeota archaeon]|nr:hypothetical protein QT06_C0001G0916 [archaeon GW2011_AR15]MBS3104601.1 hypothetical protein [Candidatus Woesearchaeota archaeon]HIH41084.1 hypothetical protein [Candidatus Woesearchaeota archaeon]
MDIKRYRNIGFGISTLLIIVVLVIAILTYTYQHHESDNPLLSIAVKNHVPIMILLTLISVSFGFFWSNLYYDEFKKQKRDTEDVTNILMGFLSREERIIIDFLIENKGSATQAEISKLPGMNKVRTYRALQRMENKNIIEKTAIGKVRSVKLKENILKILIP